MILLNGWILPIGGASAVEGLLSTGPTPSSFCKCKKIGFSFPGPLWPKNVIAYGSLLPIR